MEAEVAAGQGAGDRNRGHQGEGAPSQPAAPAGVDRFQMSVDLLHVDVYARGAAPVPGSGQIRVAGLGTMRETVADTLEPEQLFRLQPGLARLMPEIANRLWRAAYAARAGNWRLARWQVSEMRKLFELCTITRPKYADDISEYLHDDIEPLLAAIAAEDALAFQGRLSEAVDAANEFHRRWDKGYIVWRLPETAPPDLDLSAGA